MVDQRISVGAARRAVAVGCAIAFGLAFATPAMGMGEPALVRDIDPGPASSMITYPASFDGRLYFSADDGAHGRELWSSDGTEAGTNLLLDIFPGSGSSFPIGMTDAFGELIFRADDPLHGTEPWASDGTAAGTAIATDVNPGTASSYPSGLALADGRTFFQADDGVHGFELWLYERASADATLVKDLYPSSAIPGVQGTMLAIGDTAYFGGNDGTGVKLWKSDGTGDGTEQVSSHPFLGGVQALVESDGKLFFAGNDGAHGSEPWVSDGTEAGTAMLKDVRTGTLYSSPANAVDLDGVVLFTANDGSGVELWRSDGTPAGTTLVKDGVTTTGALTVVDGVAYFAGDDGVHGRELWRSDGSEEGTWMVADINAAGASISLQPQAEEIDGTLFFAANDGDHGSELWMSDGTEEGTRIVADTVAGSDGSSPSSITEAGGRVFFVAETVAEGAELWSFPLDVPPVAVYDSATVVEDAPATAVDVLGNDTDADGGPISIASVTQPAHGEVVVMEDRLGLTYRPNPDYCNDGASTDDFTYALSPGGSSATVAMIVTCVDDPSPPSDGSGNPPSDGSGDPTGVVVGGSGGGATTTEGGVVSVALTCTRATTCAGAATLTGDVPNALLATVSRVVVLARGGYSIPAGQTRAVRLQLTPVGRRALRSLGSLRGTIEIVDGATGARATIGTRVVGDPLGTAAAGRAATVHRGIARLGLRCRGRRACKGRATLAVQTRRRGKRPVRVVLGAKRFAIPAGKSTTLRVQLNRAGRSRLAKASSGRLRVRLGGTGVKPRAVVLEAARRPAPAGRR